MNDFLTKAIMIIYPDGSIDSTPVSNKKGHFDYYQELYHQSEKIKNCLEERDFNIGMSYPLDMKMLMTGAISICNWNILELSQNKNYIYQDLPGFHILFPSSFGSALQIEEVLCRFKDYPETRLMFSKMNKKGNALEEYPYEEAMRDLTILRNEMLENKTK